MNVTNQRFLEYLKAALNNKVDWTDGILFSNWQALFQLAQIHNVLPVVYETVYACPAAQRMDQQLFQSVEMKIIRQVMLQTMKIGESLSLYGYLREHGVTLLVVKELVCRGLYPQPDLRQSGDEDVLFYRSSFLHAVGS